MGQRTLYTLRRMALLAAGLLLALPGSALPVPAAPQETKAPVNYFVEGNRLRGNGECEKAVESYKKARELRQFKDDWSYHYAVADCYVALKKYDEAVDSYTRVIESSKNKTFLSELHRSRGKAYYLKAANGKEIDTKYLSLARKDIEEAAREGVDVADIESSIKRDLRNKRLKPEDKDGEDGKTITDQKVDVIESGRKMVVGNGDYALYLTGETKITDKDAQPITLSDVKAGDIIDFVSSAGYRNKADDMAHVSAFSITVHRSVSPGDRATGAEETWDREDQLITIMQKVDQLDRSISDMKGEQKRIRTEALAAKKEKPSPKKKKKKKPVKVKRTTVEKEAAKGEEEPEKGRVETIMKKFMSDQLKARQQGGNDDGERSPEPARSARGEEGRKAAAR